MSTGASLILTDYDINWAQLAHKQLPDRPPSPRPHFENCPLLRWATRLTHDLIEKDLLSCTNTQHKIRLILQHYHYLITPKKINISLARSTAINLVQYCGWNQLQIAMIADLWGYQMCPDDGITVGFSLEMPGHVER